MPEAAQTAAKMQTPAKRKRLAEVLFDRKQPATRIVSAGVQRSSSYEIGRRIDAAVEQAVEIGNRNAALLRSH
jgi:hypothetical protein